MAFVQLSYHFPHTTLTVDFTFPCDNDQGDSINVIDFLVLLVQEERLTLNT